MSLETLSTPAVPTQQRSPERLVIEPIAPTERDLVPDEIDWEPMIVTPPVRRSDVVAIDFVAGGRRPPLIADDIQGAV